MSFLSFLFPKKTHVLNTRSGEIHVIMACKYVGQIAEKNKVLLTKKKAMKYLEAGKYDGCRHCLKQYSKD